MYENDNQFITLSALNETLTHDFDKYVKNNLNEYQQSKISLIKDSKTAQHFFMGSLLFNMKSNKMLLDTDITKNLRYDSSFIGSHNIKNENMIKDKDLIELRKLGMPLHSFINTFGDNAMNMLGIKQDKSSKTDLKYDGIKIGMATAVIEMLKDKGYIEIQEIPVKDYQKMLGLSDDQIEYFTNISSSKVNKNTDKSTVKFIKFTRDKSAKNLSAKAKKLNDILDALTEIEYENNEEIDPNAGRTKFNVMYNFTKEDQAFQEPQAVNTNMAKSYEEISEGTSDYNAIAKENAVAWTYNDFEQAVDEDLLMFSDGYRDIDSIKLDNFRESQEAKNAGIEKAIQSFQIHKKQTKYFNTTDGGSPIFYTTWQKVRNSRLMQRGDFQPQNNKIHRAIASKHGSEIEIDPTAVRTNAYIDFEASINQAFEDYFADMELTSRSKNRENFNNILKDEKVNDLLETLFVKKEKPSKEQMDLFETLTDAEGTMSYKALFELFKFKKAKEQGIKFKSNLSFELDAINSALMHKIQQYGDWNKKEHREIMLGLKVAFDPKSVTEEERANAVDSYVHLVNYFLEEAGVNNNFKQAVKRILGDLNSDSNRKKLRKLFKYVVMPYIYGATTTSLKYKLIRDLESLVAKTVEKELQKGWNDTINNKIKKMLTGIGTLERTKTGKRIKFNTGRLFKSLNFIDEYFDNTYGDISNSIHGESKLMNLNFVMNMNFIEKEKEAKLEEIKKQMEKDGIESKDLPTHFDHLSKDIRESVYQNIFDKFGFSFETTLQNGNKVYALKRKSIAKDIRGFQTKITNSQGVTRTVSNRPRKTEAESLYTGGTVYFIHNLEDALQDIVLNRSTDLSIFDADIVPVGSVNKRAKSYNENAIKLNVERSQAYETVVKFYDNFINSLDHFSNGKYSFDVKLAHRMYYIINEQIAKSDKAVAKGDYIIDFMLEQIDNAIEVEKKRKNNYSKGIELNNFEYLDSKVTNDNIDTTIFDDRIAHLRYIKEDVKSAKGTFENILKLMENDPALFGKPKVKVQEDIKIALSDLFGENGIDENAIFGSDVGGDKVKKKF
jgi:hypothetical protein